MGDLGHDLIAHYEALQGRTTPAYYSYDIICTGDLQASQ